MTDPTPAAIAARLTPRQREAPSFNATRQCHWCGTDNTKGVVGYAGERQCLTCGWGGNGEPDVPCMFYKLGRRVREEVARGMEVENG